jgi:hypothetical protein
VETLLTRIAFISLRVGLEHLHETFVLLVERPVPVFEPLLDALEDSEERVGEAKEHQNGSDGLNHSCVNGVARLCRGRNNDSLPVEYRCYLSIPQLRRDSTHSTVIGVPFRAQLQSFSVPRLSPIDCWCTRLSWLIPGVAYAYPWHIICNKRPRQYNDGTNMRP